MAKLTAQTEDSAPAGPDLVHVVKAATNSRKRYLPDQNLMPDGWATNYKIVPTVSSNNLTLALKTKSGGNASATDPIGAWINSTYRRCTAALSVTKNAATDWFGSGGSFATLERDYFVYLIWNTTPATDIIDIGFSPIPYGRVYSDFSSTSTAQNYLAHANASDPAATDDCILIGRFAATLSAGAGYTWSVPTYTSVNLIQEPTDESRRLTWTPTITGFSANPTLVCHYQLHDTRVHWNINASAVGTSNATTATATLPFTAVNVSNLNYWSKGRGQDNGGEVDCTFRVVANTATLDAYKGPGNTAWTNSGNKFFSGEGYYWIG